MKEKHKTKRRNEGSFRLKRAKKIVTRAGKQKMDHGTYESIELRRTYRALTTLSKCSEALVHATSESDLLKDICRIIVEEGGYRLAWVGFAEHDAEKTVRPVAYGGFEAGYLEKLEITWADTARGRGPTGTAIRTGHPAM